MFSPEGYVPLSYLFQYRVPIELGEALIQSYAKMYVDNADGGLRTLELLTPQDFAEFDYWGALGPNCFMCSPSGDVLKIDIVSLNEQVSFWEFSLTDLLRVTSEKSEFPKVPETFYDIFKLSTVPMADVASDAAASGKTVFAEASHLGLIYAHMRIPFFYERVGYTVCLQSFDYINKLNFIESDHYLDLARLLRPFEGWALCVTERFAEDGWGKALSSRLQRFTKEFLGNETNGGGRPSVVREQTRDAYQRAYPNGHGNEPWLVVLRRVNGITGYNASLDTLKRAVRMQNPTAVLQQNSLQK